MNRNFVKFAALASVFATPGLAEAGEKPLIAPVPEWVAPVTGVDLTKLTSKNSAIPIFDQQTLVDGDLTVQYVDSAVTIGNQALLNKLGTISIPWHPQHGDLSFHAIEIIRPNERVDLLKTGADFTVLRREAQLEKQTIDGQLTAMMPAQGLRLGDVLRVAFSVSVRDTALAGRAQTAQILLPSPVTVDFGRTRLIWPEGQTLAWKSLTSTVVPSLTKTAGGMNELTTSLPIAKLAEQPKNIPVRFIPIPMIEASNFASWQDVARVMTPLYRTEGLIADDSPLAAVVDKIVAAESDPLRRAAAALRVAQDDVRYQFVALGNGNYVPQKPADTWAMRSGDCKAKTLLLLAMLHRMGIAAEPVLASSKLGDLVPDRLPSAQAFDHVLVQAEIAGASIWLDGTRLGDRFADIRNVPRLGSILPLRESGAALFALPTRADARPANDIAITYDGSAGLHLPMPFTLKETFIGQRAEQKRAEVELGSPEVLLEFARKEADRLVDSTTIVAPKATYDKDSGSWTVEVSGLAYPEWGYRDGQFSIEYGPKVSIAFEADRSKSAWRQIPALIDDPWTARATWSLTLPEIARAATVDGLEPVELDLPAVTYRRTSSRQGLTVSSVEMSGETGAEIAPAGIAAARKRIEEVNQRKLRIVAPAAYPQRWDEVANLAKANGPAFKRIKAVFDQRIAEAPKDAERYSDRAWFAKRLLDWAAAEADYGRAIALEPSVDNYVARAAVRSDRGDFPGALADAQAAYDLDSGNKSVLSELTSALGYIGKFDDALELIEQEPDPMTEQGADQVVARAGFLTRAGRLDEALTLLDNAIQRRPSLAMFLNSRCWVRALADSGLEEAMVDCNKAIELASDPAEYYDSRGLVHFRAGRLVEAKADYAAALAISPELASARFLNAVIAAREGDKALSASELKAARQLFPAVDAFYAPWGVKP